SRCRRSAGHYSLSGATTNPTMDFCQPWASGARCRCTGSSRAARARTSSERGRSSARFSAASSIENVATEQTSWVDHLAFVTIHHFAGAGSVAAVIRTDGRHHNMLDRQFSMNSPAGGAGDRARAPPRPPAQAVLLPCFIFAIPRSVSQMSVVKTLVRGLRLPSRREAKKARERERAEE